MDRSSVDRLEDCACDDISDPKGQSRRREKVERQCMKEAREAFVAIEAFLFPELSWIRFLPERGICFPFA